MEMQLAAGLPTFSWQGQLGKYYVLLASDTLAAFAPTAEPAMGTGGAMDFQLPQADSQEFFRLRISDVDSDFDGVNDWEELTLGFDPGRANTDRYSQTDWQRVIAGLSISNTITVSVYDDACGERWPDPALRVVRRNGGIQPLIVNFPLTGKAVRNVDGQTSATGSSVNFAPGQREVFIEVSPVADSEDADATETVTKTQYNAGQKLSLGLFFHSDQIEQWQTSIPDNRRHHGHAARHCDMV